MVEIVNLTEELAEQLGQPQLSSFINDFAFCALLNGIPIAAGGIHKIWEGRGYAWFCKGNVPMKAWPSITRVVESKAKLALGIYNRIEMTIYDDQDKACNWAKRLGFSQEGPKHKYLMPNGQDGWVYVLCR